MRRRPVHAAVRRLVVLTAGGLLVGACGVGPQQRPEALSPGDLPGGLRPDAEATTTSVLQTVEVDVWLVRDGRLARVRHEVEPPVTAEVALAELLAGPNEVEQARQFRSAIPDSGVVEAVVVRRGVAATRFWPWRTSCSPSPTCAVSAGSHSPWPILPTPCHCRTGSRRTSRCRGTITQSSSR